MYVLSCFGVCLLLFLSSLKHWNHVVLLCCWAVLMSFRIRFPFLFCCCSPPLCVRACVFVFFFYLSFYLAHYLNRIFHFSHSLRCLFNQIIYCYILCHLILLLIFLNYGKLINIHFGSECEHWTRTKCRGWNEIESNRTEQSMIALRLCVWVVWSSRARTPFDQMTKKAIFLKTKTHKAQMNATTSTQ